jgi:hypothetical protein
MSAIKHLKLGNHCSLQLGFRIELDEERAVHTNFVALLVGLFVSRCVTPNYVAGVAAETSPADSGKHGRTRGYTHTSCSTPREAFFR